MKKTFQTITVSLTLLFAVACQSGQSDTTVGDSSVVPPATDTMPVLHPGNLNSSGVIKTPPTNDHNVIVPDTGRNR